MPQLTTLENTLTLPGCTLHKCGLQISEEMSKEQLESIGRSLNAIGGSALWWWGDYLCHVGVKYGETLAKAAEDSSYAPSSLSTAKWVCSKLPFSMRMEELTFTHHAEALSECGGEPATAIEWLEKAQDGQWSVSKLRTEIRTANASHKEPDRKGQPSALDHMNSLQLWVRADLEAATPEVIVDMDEKLEAIHGAVRAKRAELGV